MRTHLGFLHPEKVELQLSSEYSNVLVVLLPERDIRQTAKCHEAQAIYQDFRRNVKRNSEQTILMFAVFDPKLSAGYMDMASSVLYHRLPDPSFRNYSKKTMVSTNTISAFTLSPQRNNPTSRFSVTWPAPCKSPVDTGRMLHVAYTCNDHGRLTYVLLDQYGEAMASDTVAPATGRERVARTLQAFWQAILDFCRRAAVEWRVNIVKSSLLDLEEIQGE